MGRRKPSDDTLIRLSDDDLIALYTALKHSAARLRVLDELARRGVEWAAGLADVEREQQAADQIVRQRIVDLPEVSSGSKDSDEALEEIAEEWQPSTEDRLARQAWLSKLARCGRGRRSRS